MNRHYFFLTMVTLLIGCTKVPRSPNLPKGWQQLNTGPFKISIPPSWKYQEPGEQEDSFIGQIIGPQVELSFDCSDMGYSNHLINPDDEDFKMHIVKIDTTSKYIIKTIWPKFTGKGMTGIYIHSRSSFFSFQMNGINLSGKNEKLALMAFKTIIFK